MSNRMTKIKLLHVLYSALKDRLLPLSNLSFSQEGEDLILKRFFENTRHGFYVDVGAHHPIRYSNTYLFYRKGWRGINIDACPGAMRLFDVVRPRDINLEMAVGKNEGWLKYFMFDEPALNSFDAGLSKKRHQTTSYKIVQTRQIPIIQLSSILENHLPSGQRIDFMNIDVEGMEIGVLSSNHWERFRPGVLLVELFSSSLEAILSSELHQLMTSINYSLTAMTSNNLFYCDTHARN
ncbi:MAG: FkbM family methyltransferase [Desulfatitalea sp.]|nr:FkbM family methyltransferase [Desulfatitalea sp.]